ncbi:MAG: hypothetical protein WCI74_12775 [Actinomycetes bacterium]
MKIISGADHYVVLTTAQNRNGWSSSTMRLFNHRNSAITYADKCARNGMKVEVQWTPDKPCWLPVDYCPPAPITDRMISTARAADPHLTDSGTDSEDCDQVESPADRHAEPADVSSPTTFTR